MDSPPDRFVIQAPAKINLYLRITGRRGDGYHFLATLLQKISLFDQLEFEKTSSGMELRCPDSDLPENEDNLAFRAASLFMEQMERRLPEKKKGVAVTLRKTIPIGAGLGGGSSNAGLVLRGLDRLFACGCTERELREMGGLLGADVPFFASGQPASWATGIGDQLHPAIPLSGYRILIVNPGYSVSTPWVYEKFALTAGRNKNNLQSFQNADMDPKCANLFSGRSIRPDELRNDLEPVTASHYPEIDSLKKRLISGGAAAAMMSGSGPTVFGLFHEKEADKAAACAQELKREYRNTFLVDPLQS